MLDLQAQASASAPVDLGPLVGTMINGQPMAITERHGRQLAEQIATNRFMLPRKRETGARHTDKGTAIVEIHGMLLNRAPVLGSVWGLCFYEGLIEQCRRLKSDDKVKRIVLDINSPGGMVVGIRQASAALEELGSDKPVYAIAHDMACSAGYWLASIAEELSVTPDGEVGSIGVRAAAVSYAELLDRAGVQYHDFQAGLTKTDLAYTQPLNDGAIAEAQRDIDRAFDRFVEHVAKHRPLSEQSIRDFEARCWTGDEAVERKLADRVETLDQLIARIEKGAEATRKPRKRLYGRAPAERPPGAPGTEPTAGSERKGKPMSEETKPADQFAGLAASLIAAGFRPSVSKEAPAALDENAIRAEAAEAERGRIFAILDSEEAKSRPALARRLAAKGMAADDAREILSAAAEEKSEAPAESPQQQLNSALDRQMAKGGNSGGVKPEASSEKKRPSVADMVAKRYGKKER